MELKKTVVLVGMMGAGKTAVGKALAQKLNVAFLDSDHAIEDAAQMSISEIFARDGEAFFRMRETEVIGRLLLGVPAILSTGGGAFLREENRRLIKGYAISAWLNADLDTLWHRVRHRDTRPLLSTADPYATLRDLYHARIDIYALAELHLRSEKEQSVGAMANHVIRQLKEYGAIRGSLT